MAEGLWDEDIDGDDDEDDDNGADKEKA